MSDFLPPKADEPLAIHLRMPSSILEAVLLLTHKTGVLVAGAIAATREGMMATGGTVTVDFDRNPNKVASHKQVPPSLNDNTRTQVEEELVRVSLMVYT